MGKGKSLQVSKNLLLAVKIGLGASIAIYIAEYMRLENYASAGTIALLSIMTTKWGTIKLSLWRVVTYATTVILCWVLFVHIHGSWAAYGLFLFFTVALCEWLGLRNTLSVNAVIGTHFLVKMDFSAEFIRNEFLLVVIGITVALLLNLFQDNMRNENGIIWNMRYTERELQKILEELAVYLSGGDLKDNVWGDIIELEKKIDGFVEQSYEYQNNTLYSHPSYYIEYFEMRGRQCSVLHNLHYELKKIRNMPQQAKIIADYITYLKPYVVEMNDPNEQIAKLQQIFDEMKEDNPPQSWEDFDGTAKLYHIMMDLEEFLIFKRRFVEELDERKLRIYWNKDRKL